MVLGSSGDCVGIVLELFWDCFGIGLEPFEDRLGSVLEHPGIVWATCCGCVFFLLGGLHTYRQMACPRYFLGWGRAGIMSIFLGWLVRLAAYNSHPLRFNHNGVLGPLAPMGCST